MLSIKENKSKKLEAALEAQLTKELDAVRTGEQEINEDELFVLAQYDEAAGEKTGYSNYSYWRSTVKVFFKNKVAVFLLFVLAGLLLFTFIQPYLPGQYPANQINNNPQTGKQLSNLSPSLTTVLVTVPEGTTLSAAPVKDSEGWYAVHNVLDTLQARTKFTVVEYGEAWCKVEYKGKTGYVKNNFQTKLKLPDDPTATPYESRSNFKLEMYMEPQDYTNNGTALYVEEQLLTPAQDGTAVTNAEAELRVLPSEHAFWFGTNNIGQDLWARVWSGTRTSLIIGFIVALVEAVIGITVGVLWGYVRKLDRFFTELYNFIDNIPTIIYMTLIALMIGKSTLVMAVAMIAFYWLGTARNIRNLVFMYRDREYNLASRCLGTGLWRILTKNIFPYLISVIVLRLALSIPGIIAYETTLSYLGLLDISTPSLGILLRDARSNFMSYPYLLVFPAAIVTLITVTFYLVGNAFSDACDPRNHV